MSNTDPTKFRKLTRVFAKGKQMLYLIRRPMCYSYLQSSSIKVLSVLEERKNLIKK